MKAERQLPPKLLIRRLRMIRARHLLQQKSLTVTQVAATVGILDVSYFGKCIRQEFGVAPSVLAQNLPFE